MVIFDARAMHLLHGSRRQNASKQAYCVHKLLQLTLISDFMYSAYSGCEL